MDITLDKLHPQYDFFSKWLKEPVAGLDLAHGTGLMNATARNVLRKSIKSGYESNDMELSERNNRLNDIHEINTSAKERQGRDMHESYSVFPKQYDSIYGFHFVVCMKEGVVYAYAELYRLGEYLHISRILGHYNHLKDGIMLNLIAKIIQIGGENGCKVLVYSRITDGTDGLKYWKHSIGFNEMQINER